MGWDTEKFERFRVEYDKLQFHLDRLIKEYHKTVEEQHLLSERFNDSLRD